MLLELLKKLSNNQKRILESVLDDLVVRPECLQRLAGLSQDMIERHSVKTVTRNSDEVT